MSISELLPAVHSLPDSDKLQLIRILAEDLTGNLPVWTPPNAFAAADTLLLALQTDDR